jgi:hypothetical protein
VKATKLAFEDNYCDGSGVEYAVRLDTSRIGHEIELHHVDYIRLPLDRLQWLMDALQRIASETVSEVPPHE